MTVAEAQRTISVSVPSDLADQLDAWLAEEGATPSTFVVRLIEEERRRRSDAQLEQDYRDAVADGLYDDIEFYFPAQAELWLAEPYDP